MIIIVVVSGHRAFRLRALGVWYGGPAVLWIDPSDPDGGARLGQVRPGGMVVHRPAGETAPPQVEAHLEYLWGACPPAAAELENAPC